MAELTAIDLVDAYTAGGLTDKLFTAMVASTTVRITGREIFIFKTDDDLAASIIITSVADPATDRTGDITIPIGAGAGKHGIWYANELKGFKNPATAFVTVPAVANGEMMVLRPL